MKISLGMHMEGQDVEDILVSKEGELSHSSTSCGNVESKILQAIHQQTLKAYLTPLTRKNRVKEHHLLRHEYDFLSLFYYG